MCALVTGVQPCALPICFGGLFALYALYTRPQAFNSIVAASPSLELDGGVLRDERDFVARLESEIGRASCRARVCQYVSTTVAAESLKKNNNNTIKPKATNNCHKWQRYET